MADASSIESPNKKTFKIRGKEPKAPRSAPVSPQPSFLGSPIVAPASDDNLVAIEQHANREPDSPKSDSALTMSEAQQKRKSIFLRGIDYLLGANEQEKANFENAGELDQQQMIKMMKMATPAADTGPVENLDRRHALQEVCVFFCNRIFTHGKTHYQNSSTLCADYRLGTSLCTVFNLYPAILQRCASKNNAINTTKKINFWSIVKGVRYVFVHKRQFF